MHTYIESEVFDILTFLLVTYISQNMIDKCSQIVIYQLILELMVAIHQMDIQFHMEDLLV